VGIPFAFGVGLWSGFRVQATRNAALFLCPIGNKMLKFEINLSLVVVCPVWVVILPQENKVNDKSLTTNDES
jgi:hypothetical protein